jgi:hypothetical protein
MAASIREALEGAMNEAEKPAQEPAPVADASPTSPAVDIAAASAVDADAPESKPAETPAVPKEAEPPADKPPVDDKPEGDETASKAAADAREQARQHRIDRAPQSWKKEAKGEWNNLPLHIRQEVHKREAEITRVLNQTAPDRQLAEQFKTAISPYMAMIQSRGVNPIQATEFLMRADYTLSTAPKAERAKFMADLIKQYDIDVVALDAALVGQAPQQSQQGGPDINAIVQQQLQQALAPIMQERQQQTQRQQQEVVQTVEDMAYDPKYPYFDEVRQDMADIMELSYKRGVAMSLDEAYTRATRMNPSTFEQMGKQVAISSANQQHQQAQRALKAASSVTGAPAAGGAHGNIGDGSIRGALEAAFNGARI